MIKFKQLLNQNSGIDYLQQPVFNLERGGTQMQHLSSFVLCFLFYSFYSCSRVLILYLSPINPLQLVCELFPPCTQILKMMKDITISIYDIVHSLFKSLMKGYLKYERIYITNCIDELVSYQFKLIQRQCTTPNPRRRSFDQVNRISN